MWTDPAAVARQYADAAQLDARRLLHDRFSTNPASFPRWLFAHLRATVPDAATILEIGSGPGEFWRRNQDQLPAGWRVTVTDASPVMVAAARVALSGPAPTKAALSRLAPFQEAAPFPLRFTVARAPALPGPAASNDAVIAHFMLYHLPADDRDATLAASGAALRAGGVFHAATNGADHLARFPAWLAAAGLRDPAAALPVPSFSLENGEALLRRHFQEVRLHRWRDSLAVTEVAPLLRAMLSGIEPQVVLATLPAAAAGERVAALAGMLQAELDREGVIRIPKASGLFIAR